MLTRIDFEGASRCCGETGRSLKGGAKATSGRSLLDEDQLLKKWPTGTTTVRCSFDQSWRFLLSPDM